MSQIAHGQGQMRAQSISIMTSTRTRCNAGCQFCISRTTPDDSANSAVKMCNPNRLDVGLNYAKYLGATHAVLTGKADPTQEHNEYLERTVLSCRQHLPLVDMHTNGLLLHPGMPKKHLLESLTSSGLTMITFSIAHFDDQKNLELMKIKKSAAALIPQARDLGLLVRCSVVMNQQGVKDFDSLMTYIQQAGNLGAHMVVVREVWVPENYAKKDKEIFAWNSNNRINIGPVQQQFIEVAKVINNDSGLYQRDPLPWGTPVFVVENVFDDPNHGVNVTFARCDEATKGSVIKSIVHKPDGHGYRNWDSNGDILY
ncbi:radical SAM protein [Patescibacteria group bacterium]